MNYKNKNISDLNDWELAAADKELSNIADNYNEKMKHPRIQKLSPPPEMNPTFIQLINEIKAELEKRNSTNLDNSTNSNQSITNSNPNSVN